MLSASCWFFSLTPRILERALSESLFLSAAGEQQKVEENLIAALKAPLGVGMKIKLLRRGVLTMMGFVFASSSEKYPES